MKKAVSISFCLAMITMAKAQDALPQVVSGTLHRLEDFPSEFVTARNIDVWLPEGYSNTQQYSVLYMHDGQMLYDSQTTWNQQAWDVDDVATGLFQEKAVAEFIVVGIWNGGETRHPDYFPQKPFAALSEPEKDTVTAQLQQVSISMDGRFAPQSDQYLKFLVEEVKPHIDRTYSVYTDREHTFVMGSSMGGLISMYALCEYPQVFAGAACLSTHWVGTFTLDNNPVPEAFLQYLRTHLPNPATHKIYFDCGDETLDSLYPEIQKKADQILAEKGYNDGHFMSRFFHGENHSEVAWNKRLAIPLKFLFQP